MAGRKGSADQNNRRVWEKSERKEGRPQEGKACVGESKLASSLCCSKLCQAFAWLASLHSACPPTTAGGMFNSIKYQAPFVQEMVSPLFATS